MLSDNQRARFRKSQALADAQSISSGEQAELDSLIEVIEIAEAAYLQPATERIKAERAEIESQNEELRALLHRQERLANRLEDEMERSHTEPVATSGESNAGLLSRLKQIRIDAPDDFAANLDQYTGGSTHAERSH